MPEVTPLDLRYVESTLESLMAQRSKTWLWAQALESPLHIVFMWIVDSKSLAFWTQRSSSLGSWLPLPLNIWLLDVGNSIDIHVHPLPTATFTGPAASSRPRHCRYSGVAPGGVTWPPCLCHVTTRGSIAGRQAL